MLMLGEFPSTGSSGQEATQNMKCTLLPSQGAHLD